MNRHDIESIVTFALMLSVVVITIFGILELAGVL